MIPRVLGILMLIPFCPVVKASDVGGISATSNPVANSSGQANVNAYQVLTGNFMQSAFTNGVVCQSETLTIKFNKFNLTHSIMVHTHNSL